jgi:hypothetical protein
VRQISALGLLLLLGGAPALAEQAAWVKEMTRLRFLAGVDDKQGTTSKAFFAGLSAAVSKECPGVW